MGRRRGWRSWGWAMRGLELLEGRALLTSGWAWGEREYEAGRVLARFRGGEVGVMELTPGVVVSPGLGVIERALEVVPGLVVIRLEDGVSVGEAVERLGSDPRVAYAQPDLWYRTRVVPNDASFGSQWALHNTGQSGGTADADIDAVEAWDVVTGTGNEVVAVIDTGVDYLHPDLVENIWTNAGETPGNGIDDDNNGYIDDYYGWDFANNDNNPMDDHGHGTHVAGTVGARGNNGEGITGVAWTARIMSLKFLKGNGVGSTSDAIEAVEYAVRNGARISNNSWGSVGFDEALHDAVSWAGAQGHLFVAAAGNDALDIDIYEDSPGGFELPSLISVAATNRNDTTPYFTNFGWNTVSLGAPGSVILSTTPGNTYSTYSGTSMAAPHVAGAAALVWARYPFFTVEEVIERLTWTTDATAAMAGRVKSGGRLNLARAVSSEMVYVSDLPFTSELNGLGPVERDRANGGGEAGDGGEIVLGGQAYAKGLGVAGGSRVEVELGGGFHRFLAMVGLDGSAGTGGSVTFQVWGDGELLWDSGVMTGLSGVRAVDVDLWKRERLALVTTDAGNGAAGDAASWGDARVERPSALTSRIGLRGERGEGYVRLRWDAVEGASYRLYRSTTEIRPEALPAVYLSGVATEVLVDVPPSVTTRYFYAVEPVLGGISQGVSRSIGIQALPRVVQHVSDLVPVSSVNGVGPIEADRSNGGLASGDGPRLQIGGTTYVRGLGTSASARVEYNLNGQFARFLADIGGHEGEGSGAGGSVVYEVQADGRVLFRSGVMTAGGPGQSVDVSVAGRNRLVLLVHGAGGAMGGAADWGNARLVRSSSVAVPGGVAAVGGDGLITLSWNAATGASSYAVYRSTNGVSWSPLPQYAEVRTTRLVDSGLDPSRRYWYRVVGVGSNHSSLPSQVVSAMTTSVVMRAASELAVRPGLNGLGPYERDQSNGENAPGDGPMLRIDGTAYSKGLGTYGNVWIEIPLGGQYERFRAVLGLNDATTNGTVQYQVQADGVVLYTSPVLTGGSAALPIDLDVSGRQLMVLEVSEVENSTADRADWGEASLVAAPAVAAPSGLVATGGDGSVRLSWAAVPGATSYRVFRWMTGQPESTTPYLTQVLTTAVVDSGLDAGVSLTYRVVAVRDGRVSAGSSVVEGIATGVAVESLSGLPFVSARNGFGPVERNRSNGGIALGDGPLLRIDGVTYTQGLGTHADARVQLLLGGAYARFQAEVGLNDAVGAQGSVIYRVLGDGVVLYDSGLVTGLTATRGIDVEVTGRQVLELVVDKNTDKVGDHADWGNARLVPLNQGEGAGIKGGKKTAGTFGTASRVGGGSGGRSGSAWTAGGVVQAAQAGEGVGSAGATAERAVAGLARLKEVLVRPRWRRWR